MNRVELADRAQTLAVEMRRVNITSYGLRQCVHERWCREMQEIADALKEPVESIEKAPPPRVPAPPKAHSKVV